MEFLCLFIRRTVNNNLYKSRAILLQTCPEFIKLYKNKMKHVRKQLQTAGNK